MKITNKYWIFTLKFKITHKFESLTIFWDNIIYHKLEYEHPNSSLNNIWVWLSIELSLACHVGPFTLFWIKLKQITQIKHAYAKPENQVWVFVLDEYASLKFSDFDSTTTNKYNPSTKCTKFTYFSLVHTKSTQFSALNFQVYNILYKIWCTNVFLTIQKLFIYPT